MDPRPVGLTRAIPRRRLLAGRGDRRAHRDPARLVLLARPWDRAGSAARADGLAGDHERDPGRFRAGGMWRCRHSPISPASTSPACTCRTALRATMPRHPRPARSAGSERTGTSSRRTSAPASTRSLAPGPNDLVLPVTGSGGEPLAADGSRGFAGPRLPASTGSPAAGLGRCGSHDRGRDPRRPLRDPHAHRPDAWDCRRSPRGYFLKDVTLTLSAHDTIERRGRHHSWLTQPRSSRVGHYSPCNLTVYKNAWSTETPGQPAVSRDARAPDPRGHPLLPVPGRRSTSSASPTADAAVDHRRAARSGWPATTPGSSSRWSPGLWRKYIMGKP